MGLAPQERDDDAVLTILMDLRLSQVLTQSNRLAEHLLQEARRSRVVAAKKVKQAGFQVLRTLAMPSVLVEVAYLSNRSDRELLTTADGRRKLARILCEGIFAWRGERPPAGGRAGRPSGGPVTWCGGGTRSRRWRRGTGRPSRRSRSATGSSPIGC